MSQRNRIIQNQLPPIQEDEIILQHNRRLQTEISADSSYDFERNQNQVNELNTPEAIAERNQLTKEQINKWIESFSAYLVFFILLEGQNLFTPKVISWEMVFIPLFILDLKVIFQSIIEYKKPKEQWGIYYNQSSQKIYAKDIIDGVLIIIFKILICAAIRIQNFQPILVGIPLWMGLVIRTFFCAWPRHDCQSFSALIRAIGRFFRALLCLTVLLRVEHLVEWNWKATFWPFWVVLGLLLILNLGIWLLCCGSICSFFMGDALLYEIITSIWLFCVISGLSVSSCLFVIWLSDILDGDNVLKIYQALIIPIVYLSSILIITKLVYRFLPSWWNSFFSPDSVENQDSENNSQSSNQQSQNTSQVQILPSQNQNNQQNNSRQAAIRRVIQQIKKPPKYLMRMSSTYFGRPANFAFIPKVQLRFGMLNNPNEKKLALQTLETQPKDDNAIIQKKETDETVEQKKRKKNQSMPHVLKQAQHKFNSSIATVGRPSLDNKQRNCCICFDNIADAVIMECGHGGLCYNCSLEMWKSTGECHLCRVPISQVVQCDFTRPGKFVKVFSATRAIYGDEEGNGEEQEEEAGEAGEGEAQQEAADQNVSVLESQNISVLDPEDFQSPRVNPTSPPVQNNDNINTNQSTT